MLSRKIARSILVTILLTGLGISTAGTASALYSLQTVSWGSWKLYSQQDTNWCWAAGAKMAIQKSTGTSPTECTFVNKAKGTASCANTPATLSDIARGLKAYNVTPYQNTGTPSFSHARYVTTRGGGLTTAVKWQTGTVGHIAPLVGTTESGLVYLTYIRTTGVSATWITYDQFRNGTAGLGSPYTPNGWIATY